MRTKPIACQQYHEDDEVWIGVFLQGYGSVGSTIAILGYPHCPHTPTTVLSFLKGIFSHRTMATTMRIDYSKISEFSSVCGLCVRTSPRMKQLDLFSGASSMEESETFRLQCSSSESCHVNAPWRSQAFENYQVPCQSLQLRSNPPNSVDKKGPQPNERLWEQPMQMRILTLTVYRLRGCLPEQHHTIRAFQRVVHNFVSMTKSRYLFRTCSWDTLKDRTARFVPSRPTSYAYSRALAFHSHAL